MRGYTVNADTVTGNEEVNLYPEVSGGEVSDGHNPRKPTRLALLIPHQLAAMGRVHHYDEL